MKTPADLITAVHRGRHTAAIVLLAVCAGIGAAALVTVLTPKTYEARASLLVTDGRSGTPSGLLAQSLVPTVARLAESREVALGTAARTGLPESQVIGHITAESQPSLQIVTLTATAGSARTSAAIANAATRFLSAHASDWLSEQRGAPEVKLLDRAASPVRPVTPMPLLNHALGGLLGLLAGIGFASMHRRADDRLREPAQVETELGLPVLGVLSRVPRRLTRRGARAVYGREHVAGAVREAVATMTVLTHASDQRRLLVAGIREDSDTAMAAALLALGMAEGNDRVTLVDAHRCGSALLRHFPEAAEHSLQQALADPDTALEPRLAWPASLTVLAAEPAEASHGARIFHSGPFSELLTRAGTDSDVLLVHTPAILDCPDSALLGQHVDAAVLAVRSGAVGMAQARRAVQLLRRLDIPVTGVFLMGTARLHRHTLGWPERAAEQAMSTTPTRRVPPSRSQPEEDQSSAGSTTR